MPSQPQRHHVIPAVFLILHRKDGKFLMMRRANTGYMDGWFGLPSGHVEGAEAADMAMVREAREEIGIKVDAGDLRFVHIMHRQAEGPAYERVDIVFETSVWKGEPINAEPHKCDELRWVSLDDLPENTIPPVRQFLVLAHKGEYYSSDGFEKSLQA